MSMFIQMEEYNSPTNANSKDNNYEFSCKTPFSKGAFNSKSPKRSLLKKSKRRECTPDSPQHAISKLICLINTNYESENTSQCAFQPKQLFNESSKIAKKNITLSLIEEHIEEVTDRYYDFLGKQNTPESLFHNLFFKDNIPEGEIEKNNDSLHKINSIITELNNLDYLETIKHEDCRVVLISLDFTYNEVPMEYFISNFATFEIDQTQIINSCTNFDENGFFIIKGTVIFKDDSRFTSRLLFRNSEVFIKLSIIELCL